MLASIKKIKAIKKIKKADFICAYQVDGWWIVDGIDKYVVGENVIFIEIDSFLPCNSIFEFLRASSYKNDPRLGEGFLLKTVKLRGQVSQGLILPMSVLDKEYVEGDDVTEALNIKKYEKYIDAGCNLKYFPYFIKKTDQKQIQIIYNKIVDRVVENKCVFEITEKLDGSSVTLFHNNGNCGICSRNTEIIVDLDNKENMFVDLYNQFKTYLPLCKNIAVQGELCGPKIQGNKYELPTPTFYIFDIWDIDEQRYFNQADRMVILEFLKDIGLNFNTVPMIDTKQLSSFDELLESAKGRSVLNQNVKREGLVFKSLDYIDGKVLSFKVINNDFLLEYDE